MSRIRIFFVPFCFRNRNYDVTVREFEVENGVIEYKINSHNEGLNGFFDSGDIVFYRHRNSKKWEYEYFDPTTEVGMKKKNILQSVINYLEAT